MEFGDDDARTSRQCGQARFLEMSPREWHAASELDRRERWTIARRLMAEGRLEELPAALEAQAAATYWRRAPMD